MKKLIVMLMLLPLFLEAQRISQRQIQHKPNPDFNESTTMSVCGFDEWCDLPQFHYKPKGWVIPDKMSIPIYSPDYCYIGDWTDMGFIVTKRKDHLVGKPLAKELLSNPKKMQQYLLSIF